MRIAVASGKGGTGKTTVAVNLAYLLISTGKKVQYLDCDVEEPNGHIFLKPVIDRSTPALVRVPVVDQDKSTSCGECSNKCQFHALVVLPGSTLVFPELCHGCGLCSIVCPAKAITETMREVGRIETGTGLLGVKFARGILNVGEPMASPVISSLTGAHFAVLVTEPTMTGVHDLERVLSLARHFDMKTAVVVNKGDLDPSCTEDIRSFCRQRQVGFLGSIPYEPLITEAQRQRKTVLDYAPESRASIERLVFP